MSNMYLFTGENAYSLGLERRKWASEFSAKHGADNLLRLEASALRFRDLIDEVSTMPFLAQKRLVMVDGIPRFTKEEVRMLPAEIHPDCLLVFMEPKPDNRLAGTKELQAHALVRHFAVVQGAALRTWVQQYASACGASLDRSAMDALLAIVGEDQGMLAHELEKLSLYASGRTITADDIRALSVPFGEKEVWALTNELASGRVDRAFRTARDILSRGEDVFGLWSILLWSLKNIVLVFAASQEGVRSPAEVASRYGVPFPSVRALQPFASALSLSTLRAVVRWAAEADIELKTGGYRATQEAPEELEALIDQFMMRCSAP